MYWMVVVKDGKREHVWFDKDILRVQSVSYYNYEFELKSQALLSAGYAVLTESLDLRRYARESGTHAHSMLKSLKAQIGA